MIQTHYSNINGANTLVALGADEPIIVLYTATLPLLPVEPCQGDQLNIAELIALNGNHWRKIFSIYAKLLAPLADDWRHYRDHHLLHRAVQIRLANAPTGSELRIVAGKASWEALACNTSTLEVIDKHAKLFVDNQTLCTPYFDYRQFPNSLVTIAREWLQPRLQNRV